METILVQIRNNKAGKLLQKLEKLHLIKLLKTGSDALQKLAEKYAGKLSAAAVEKLQQHIQKINIKETPEIFIYRIIKNFSYLFSFSIIIYLIST